MSSLWLDVRYALRMLAKSPGPSAILLLTLALGIGASTTIFSIVNSVVLRPLPYAQPERLVRAYTVLTGAASNTQLGVSVPGFHEFSRGCHTCAQVAAWEAGSLALTNGDRAVRAEATYTTFGLAALLDVHPLLGRWFDAAEDRPGDPQVVVIGYELWQRVFAGDRNVIGKQARVDAVPVTVIGVMPPGFRFPERGELWLPTGFDFGLASDGNAAAFNLSVIARLAPGVELAAFAAELAAEGQRWNETVAKIVRELGIPSVALHTRAVMFHDDLVGSLATTLWLLQAAVLFVLLISVVNVANLLLARSEARTREVAVRHALGASRRRLIRQFITESLILGLAGGALGVLVAMWALDGVTALIPRSAPRVAEIALDGRAVGFAVACAIGAALIFGLAPILHARRTDLHGALKDGSSRMTGNKARLRARRLLVIGEIALAVVLVVGCTVMVRSFLELQQVELGFQPDHLLTFGVDLPARSYPPDAVDAFWRRELDRVRALPGVRSAGLIGHMPPQHPKLTDGFRLPGRSASAPGEPDWITDFLQTVDPGAYEALGARIVRGRGFALSDTRGTPPVAMVNASFAAKFFRDRDPIGQQVQLLFDDKPAFTVIGVVADIKGDGVERPAGTELILPLWQSPTSLGSRLMFTVLRTTGDPADLIPAVQRAMAELDPALPVVRLRPMDDVVWEAVARPRFLMFLLTSFAGIALLLAAVGIYGVMAHTVAQRTHEIGLRVALGARPAQVRAMVLRQAAALVAIGVAIGLAAAVALALALGTTLTGLLYGGDLIQPVVLVAVALAVALAALLATWIPARRATQVQPTVALRAE